VNQRGFLTRDHSVEFLNPVNLNRRCFMPKRCAVWLDHSEALIVRFSNDGEPRIEKLESGIESITKSTGGARARQPYMHGSAARHSDQEKRNQQLSKFYDKIVLRVKDSPKIILMGPGLAKQELGKTIDELPGLQRHNVELHSAERMTDRQLVALARKELDVPVPV